jgi:polyribonucleotide nucleotidyltransferase
MNRILPSINVCAGTLSLMDAGIQMIRPVSGIGDGIDYRR